MTGIKDGAWEVEETAMDLQADDAGFGHDPYATAVFARPPLDDHPGPGQAGTGTHAMQGQLFADGYPTYARTDEIPAVSRSTHVHRRPRTSRLLRVAVVVVAVAVVGAGVALGLVKAGVLKGTSTGGSAAGTSTTLAQAHDITPATTPKAPLATQVSTGNGSATYSVPVTAYAVTVSTSTGRSWVSIGAPGQTPAFAGIVPPNSSRKQILLGPAQVDVGAGGTKITVTSNHRSTTLTPPSAPFTYQFQTKSG